MNILKIKVGYDHPIEYEQSSDLEIFYNDEVYLNLDNILYVRPFTRYIRGRTWTFYSIQLAGDKYLFSLDNPLDNVNELRPTS